MCSVAVVGAIGAGVSAAAQIGGSVMEADRRTVEANMAAEDAERQAAAADEQAGYYQEAARDALDRGGQAASAVGVEGRAVAADAKTQAAARGMDAEAGLRVEAQSRYDAARDADLIRADAARKAWGFTNEAETQKEAVAALRERAKVTRRLGFLGATAAGIEGAGKVASTVSRYASSKG